MFQEALQDIKRCHKLETFIGRDAVVEMIDRKAGMEITFSEYPRNIQFIPDLMEKMNRIIERYTMRQKGDIQ